MTQLSLPLAPKHIQQARDAYKNAPHGYKLKNLYRLQQAVLEQLRRETGRGN